MVCDEIQFPNGKLFSKKNTASRHEHLLMSNGASSNSAASVQRGWYRCRSIEVPRSSLASQFAVNLPHAKKIGINSSIITASIPLFNGPSLCNT
jgi:hypothetical protein